MNPLSVVFGAVGDLIGGIKDIFSKKLQNDADKIEASVKLGELQVTLQQALLDADAKFAAAQQAVIVAEAQSQSWVARNWRPLLMLTFTFAFAWNYIIAPLAHLQILDLPQDAWTLMKIGVGGYIVGRSAEKAVASWSAGSNGNGSTSGE